MICYIMINIIDELAYQGPFILTIFTAIELLLSKGVGGEKWLFFVVFLLGFWLNNRLNEILKDIIREPRPIPFDLRLAQSRDPLRLIRQWFSGMDELYLSRAHIWGMPSGHAQIASFSLTFYYLVHEKYLRVGTRIDKSILIFGGMCLLFIITLYQRWETRAHTINQLLMGTIVGVLFAGSLIFCLRWWLQETRKKKEE